MSALAAAWTIAIHGPAAIATNPTYSWLAESRTGRNALRSIWIGLHLICAGNLALLAIGMRRTELTGGLR